MATEPNRVNTFLPQASFTRMNMWHDTTANAVYLLGSLLFLAGEMQTGSLLFIIGNAAALLRLAASATRRFRFGMLHEIVPLLLYLVGSCFYYVRDVPTGTFLFIAGSVYVLAVQTVPAIRRREFGVLKTWVPLGISLLGCFFFLTSVRVIGTLLFIVSNAILLHRSLHVLSESYASGSSELEQYEEAASGSPGVPEWMTVPVVETMTQLHQ